MREIDSLVLPFHTDAETACLRVTQIGAAAHLKIFFLPRRPSLYVNTLDLQVRKVAGTALKRADRDIQRAEKVNGVHIQFFEPVHALFRLTDDDHFLFFKLVDTVNAPFLNAVRAHLFAEAGRIAGEGLRKLALVENGVNKLADHGMFARTDEIEVFPFDLIHHVFHLREAHDPVNNAPADHKRRDIIGKAPVDHKITRVGKNRGMQQSDWPAEIIKPVAAGFTGTVKVNAVYLFHDIHMVRNFKIRNDRFTEPFQLHIFAVILADGD